MARVETAPTEPGQPSLDGFLARVARRFTTWAERSVPDAFVFALAATFVVILVAWRRTPLIEIVLIWGGGFWRLLEFTLQMALVIITGCVVQGQTVLVLLPVVLVTWLGGTPSYPL